MKPPAAPLPRAALRPATAHSLPRACRSVDLAELQSKKSLVLTATAQEKSRQVRVAHSHEQAPLV